MVCLHQVLLACGTALTLNAAARLLGGETCPDWLCFKTSEELSVCRLWHLHEITPPPPSVTAGYLRRAHYLLDGTHDSEEAYCVRARQAVPFWIEESLEAKVKSRGEHSQWRASQDKTLCNQKHAQCDQGNEEAQVYG